MKLIFMHLLRICMGTRRFFFLRKKNMIETESEFICFVFFNETLIDLVRARRKFINKTKNCCVLNRLYSPFLESIHVRFGFKSKNKKKNHFQIQNSYEEI